MKQVFTTRGPLPRDSLYATDKITEEHNSREIATEWRVIGDLTSEIVRRDVWISILMPQQTEVIPGSLGE